MSEKDIIIPPHVCHVCKRVAPPDGGDIVHKQFCTAELRNVTPRRTRQTAMEPSRELPRTPTSGAAAGPDGAVVTSSAAAVTTPTFTTTTAASSLKPTHRPQLGPAEHEALHQMQRIEQLEREQQEDREQREQLERDLKVKTDAADVAHELLADANADTAAAKLEAAGVMSDLDKVAIERDRLRDERDQLKRTAGTPRQQPPVSATVQAFIDTFKQQFELQQQQHQQRQQQLIDALKPKTTPTSSALHSTPKVNPAARALNLPILEDPTNVNLHHFTSWRHHFELYGGANNLNEEPFQARKAFVSNALHTHWVPLIQSGDVNWIATQSLTEMLDAIADYIKLRRHPLLDRRDFLTRQQRSTESPETFLQQLRELLLCSRYSEELTFPLSQRDFERTLLRDLFLRGISNGDLRKEILKKPLHDLPLEKVMEISRTYESALTTSDNLSGPKRVQVARRPPSSYKRGQKNNAILRRSGHTANPIAKPTSVPNSGSHTHPDGQTTQRRSGPVYHRACNQTHAFGSGCSAATHTCSRCGTKGHVESSPRCSKNPAATNSKKPQNVRVLRLDNDSDHADGLLAVKVMHQGIATHKATWKFLPDSGADVTAASLSDVTRLVGKRNLSLSPPPSAINAAGGMRVDVVGSLSLNLSFNGRTISVICYVFDKCETPLLSKRHLIKLGLLPEGWPNVVDTIAHVSAQRELKPSILSPSKTPPLFWNPSEIYSEYPKVFSEDGKFRQMKGPPLTISLVDGAIPFKLYKPYTVPLHYEKQLRAKLDEMIANGVLERVPRDEIPEWTAGLVVVDKKDSKDIRITVDLSKLNKFVKRPGFAITIPSEKIRAIPSGMRFYTVFDATKGYWQVPLEPESRHLTTFLTTTHNLLRHRVLPMGLNLAASAFGQRVEQALRGLTNSTSVVEDILVYSPTLEQHKEHVKLVLDRCREHGIQLNKAKMQFAKETVDYCGYRLTSLGDTPGYSPSPHLISAIKDFPRPSNKTDIRSFVGLVNVFRDYDESIAELVSPLTSLMSPKIDFLWTAAQESAFVSLKSRLASPKILTHFIPDQPLRLESDASRRGLGFILFQQGMDYTFKILQVGSRNVTDTESRYSVTELELLAVAWALDKARFFCAGAPQLELIVDHRPLVSIINSKSLGDLTTPRILRLRQRLYRFPALVAVWREGKKQIVADALSRNPVGKPDESDLLAEHDVEETVCSLNVRNIRFVSFDDGDSIDLSDDDDVTKSIATSDLLHDRLKRAARSDSTYRKLHELVQSEFPDHKSQLDDDLKPFWSCRDFLSANGPLVLYKHRTVIPQELQQSVLDRLHASHSGVTKTLLRVQQSVFWPGISHHVRDKIQRCPQCQRFRVTNAPETPLHNVDFENPTAAFQFLSLDFFHCDKQEWLVISCNFSGYFNIYRMGRSATASDLIRSIRDWSSHFGYAIRIRSDGGPQMDSAAYRDFCEEHYIRPNFSSPLMHCSTAETAVKCAKNILRKCPHNSNAYFAALLEYRSSPRSISQMSPNDLVYKTQPRTLVPVFCEENALQAPLAAETANARQREKQSLADTYVRHKDDREPLSVGQPVLLQDAVTKLWDRQGTILRRITSRRSYLVELAGGGRLWRNRKLLQPVPSTESDDVGLGDDSSADETATAADAPPSVAAGPRRGTRIRCQPNRF